MNGKNSVHIIGQLGDAPKYTVTSGGRSVLRMRVAVNETVNDGEGRTKQVIEWFSVVIWGKRADGLNTFLAKGQTVSVYGKLRSSSWEGRDGQKRTSLEVVADDILVFGRPEREAAARAGTHEPPAPSPRAEVPNGPGDIGDYGAVDEIPF